MKTKENIRKSKLNKAFMEQLKSFSQIGKTLTSTLDIKEVMKIVMENTSKLLKPKNWSLLLIDEKTNELFFEIAVGPGADKIKDLRLQMGQGIAGWVAEHKESLLVPDVYSDPRFYKKADEKSNFTTRSIICVPMTVGDKCLGVLQFINHDDEGSFREEDLILIETIADYTAIALENASLFEKIKELSITDDLTGLHNSRYLEISTAYEFERAKRFEYDLSVIFLDLDHFKFINDKHGHMCGSQALREAADVIKNTIRKIDIAFRYGGDEFVIIMPETSKEHCMIVCKKLLKNFRDHIYLEKEGISCQLTSSIGFATYPTDADNIEEILKLADDAMYRVKNISRNDVAAAEKK